MRRFWSLAAIALLGVVAFGCLAGCGDHKRRDVKVIRIERDRGRHVETDYKIKSGNDDHGRKHVKIEKED